MGGDCIKRRADDGVGLASRRADEWLGIASRGGPMMGCALPTFGTEKPSVYPSCSRLRSRVVNGSYCPNSVLSSMSRPSMPVSDLALRSRAPRVKAVPVSTSGCTKVMPSSSSTRSGIRSGSGATVQSVAVSN